MSIICGDCVTEMAKFGANTFDLVFCDPPYGLEFMGEEWDRLGWQAGGGFSKPGIGQRDTEWASYSSTSRFGTANPTCATCGGRLRGAKKCDCPEPDWKPIGKRRNPENEGLPDDMTGGGYQRHLSAMQDWHRRWAVEALRVLKPGGHLLAFGGTRTHHRLMCGIEDAGFEIRDCAMLFWTFGQGFPKSADVSKMLDKAAGVTREDKFKGLGREIGPTGNVKCPKCGKWLVSGSPCKCPRPQDEPQSELAKQFKGYGTSLKPAYEPIVVARKPLDGTIAANVTRWGCGAVNVDAGRIATTDTYHYDRKGGNHGSVPWSGLNCDVSADSNPKGRFPANVLLDEATAEKLDAQAGECGAFAPVKRGCDGQSKGIYGDYASKGDDGASFRGDSGGPSRFFYTSKAGADERYFKCRVCGTVDNDRAKHKAHALHCDDCGVDYAQEPTADSGMERMNQGNQTQDYRPDSYTGDGPHKGHACHSNLRAHPTVKPRDLLRYFLKLYAPPNSHVLDPFAGTASIGLACLDLGLGYTGIEIDGDFADIGRHRLTDPGAIRGDRPASRPKRKKRQAPQSALDL